MRIPYTDEEEEYHTLYVYGSEKDSKPTAYTIVLSRYENNLNLSHVRVNKREAAYTIESGRQVFTIDIDWSETDVEIFAEAAESSEFVKINESIPCTTYPSVAGSDTYSSTELNNKIMTMRIGSEGTIEIPIAVGSAYASSDGTHEQEKQAFLRITKNAAGTIRSDLLLNIRLGDTQAANIQGYNNYDPATPLGLLTEPMPGESSDSEIYYYQGTVGIGLSLIHI